MPVVDAYGDRKKHEVMDDTWGHTYPKPGSKHRGVIILGQGTYGDQVVLDSSFPTLNCSPQRYELEHSLRGPDREVGVFRVECTLWFYKSSSDMYLNKAIGRVIKKSVTQLVNEL